VDRSGTRLGFRDESVELKSSLSSKRGGYFCFESRFIRNLPIRNINFSDPADVAATATASDRNLYKRQIDATDREIDRLVYELYGLTEKEIAVVEQKG
jgi:hypothetical protein